MLGEQFKHLSSYACLLIAWDVIYIFTLLIKVQCTKKVAVTGTQPS